MIMKCSSISSNIQVSSGSVPQNRLFNNHFPIYTIHGFTLTELRLILPYQVINFIKFKTPTHVNKIRCTEKVLSDRCLLRY